MPGDEDMSPRNAIRQWLHNTVIHPNPDFPADHAGQNASDARSKSSRKKESEANKIRSLNIAQRSSRQREYGEARSKDVVTECGRMTKQPPRGEQEKLGLAERLGLHSPFRAFKDRSDEGDLAFIASDRPRKRKRHASSSNFDLEPAYQDDTLNRKYDNFQTAEPPGRKAKGRRLAEVATESLSEISSGSTHAKAPRQFTEPYTRKPRHRTKEDHYELKDQNGKKKHSTKQDKRAEKKPKSRRRKEKSGAALMHDFSAQNVSHDRLTVSWSKLAR